MLTTNLTGNFGNHMWYYSICRIVAEKKGFDWGINPVATHDYYSGQSQFYFMEIDYGKEVKVVGKNERGLNVYDGITNEYYDTPKPYKNCLINFYDPNVFDVEDNTMIHLISQSERYLLEHEGVAAWFTIKAEFKEKYDRMCQENNIVFDSDTCVINFRGGEYHSVPNLIASKNYWSNCIKKMLDINRNMKFIIITDDKKSALWHIGDYPCFHFDIGFDFYVVNQAKYLILSNSSFGWWAGWLNQSANLIIAPKYWSQHNTSDGYWGLGDQYTSKFHYMDREGNINDYNTCRIEAIDYYTRNGLV